MLKIDDYLNLSESEKSGLKSPWTYKIDVTPTNELFLEVGIAYNDAGRAYYIIHEYSNQGSPQGIYGKTVHQSVVELKNAVTEMCDIVLHGHSKEIV